MLFLFHGEPVAAGNKAANLRSALLAKRPNAAALAISGEHLNAATLQELIGSAALFGGSYIVSMRGAFGSAENLARIKPHLKELAASPNIFIAAEGELSATTLALLSKHAEKIVAVKAKEARKRSFNIFTLSDALYAKDRKELWVALMRARAAGHADEEIAGTWWFALKSLLSASAFRTPADAGLSPFPFQKAKRALSHFAEGEVEMLSMRLVALYHDAHRGEGPMNLALERFALSV